tara:strand:- start:2200 stop:2475 length:276 start_codon:yes stop_codon:yes gene_type:complete
MLNNEKSIDFREWLVVDTDRCTHYFPRDMFKESKYEILDIFCSNEVEVLGLDCVKGFGVRLGSYGSDTSAWQVFDSRQEAEDFIAQQRRYA